MPSSSSSVVDRLPHSLVVGHSESERDRDTLVERSEEEETLFCEVVRAWKGLASDANRERSHAWTSRGCVQRLTVLSLRYWGTAMGYAAMGSLRLLLILCPMARDLFCTSGGMVRVLERFRDEITLLCRVLPRPLPEEILSQTLEYADSGFVVESSSPSSPSSPSDDLTCPFPSLSVSSRVCADAYSLPTGPSFRGGSSSDMPWMAEFDSETMLAAFAWETLGVLANALYEHDGNMHEFVKLNGVELIQSVIAHPPPQQSVFETLVVFIQTVLQHTEMRGELARTGILDQILLHAATFSAEFEDWVKSRIVICTVGEPIRWVESDAGPSLFISAEGTRVFSPGASDSACRGPDANAIYWEVEGIDEGPGLSGASIRIGICPSDMYSPNYVFSGSSLYIQPFHSPPGFRQGDRLGVGLDLQRERLLFFKNGVYLDSRTGIDPSKLYYPVLSHFTRRMGIQSIQVDVIPDFSII